MMLGDVDILSRGMGMGIQFALIVALIVIVGAGFMIFGGYDRWRRKVPLMIRGSEDIYVYFEDEAGVGRERHNAVLWPDKETGAEMCYFPKIKNDPFALPAGARIKKPIRLWEAGDLYIPVKGVEYFLQEIKGIDVTRKPIRKEVLFNITLPSMAKMKEDIQMQMSILAELLRPKTNPMVAMAQYAIFGLLVVGFLFTMWFSSQQSIAALNVAPNVVREAAELCKETVLNETMYM